MTLLLPLAAWLSVTSPFPDIIGDLPDPRPPATSSSDVELALTPGPGRSISIPLTVDQEGRYVWQNEGVPHSTTPGVALKLEFDERTQSFHISHPNLWPHPPWIHDVVTSHRPAPRMSLDSPSVVFSMPSIGWSAAGVSPQSMFVYVVRASEDGALVGVYANWTFYEGENIRPIWFFRLGPDGRWAARTPWNDDEVVLLDDGSVLYPQARRTPREEGRGKIRGPFRVTLRGDVVPFRQRLRAVRQGPERLWGIRRSAFRDTVVSTTRDGRTLGEVQLARPWRALRPMPFSGGACVVVQRKNAEELRCYDSTHRLRFSRATPEHSTYLTANDGSVFVGTRSDVRVYAPNGILRWQVRSTVHSNLLVTPEHSLCWLEQSGVSLNVRCLDAQHST